MQKHAERDALNRKAVEPDAVSSKTLMDPLLGWSLAAARPIEKFLYKPNSVGPNSVLPAGHSIEMGGEAPHLK